MTSPDLPAELKAALDAKLHGLSRSDAAARSARISETYRGGDGSAAIRSEADALAYALARMPATYAAVTASLNALCEMRPGFAPKRLLDIGAGPGTATWAAAEAFSSLTDYTSIDANGALRTLALDLFDKSACLSSVRYLYGEARNALADADAADLVVASYLLGEMQDAERADLADLMWARTSDTLLVVEPGTPAGYARIIALRAQLIAQEAHVAAPCPHDAACPLIAPDWCHFAQRLPRSQAHKQLKAAELPFEDEKFAYVALTRATAPQRPSRVLAQPVVGKVEVTAKLCTTDGVVVAKVPRRAKADYARARRWRWGDAVIEEQTLSASRPGEGRDP
jgi:ribosomal protein RSM22 (predicted rRNA methylase)